MFATDILPIEVWRLIIARLSNPRDLLSMALCQREDWSEYALERLHSQVRFHSIQQRDGFFSALLNVVETVSPKLDSLSSLVSKNVQEEEEEEEEAAVINTNSLPQQMMLLDNNLLASLSLHAHPSSHPSSQRRQTQQLPSLEWISSSNWSSQVFDQEEVVSPYFPRSATLQNMPKITAADSLVSSAAITRCNSIENINNFSSKTKMLHNILLVRSLDFGLDVFGPNIDSSTKSGDDQINSSFTLMHGASGMQLANDHAEEEEDEIFPLSRSSVYQPGPLRSLSSSVYDLTTIASINQAEEIDKVAQDWPVTPPHTPPEHATTATINEEYISAASDEDMYSDEEDEHGSVPMLIEKKQVSITSSSLSNEDDRGYGKIWNHNFINSFLPLISLHLAPTLTTLRLSRAQYDTDLLIPTLASLTLLTHLDLSYSSVRAPLLEYLAGGEENNNSRGLKCLDLSGCFTLRRHAAPLFTNILMNQGINGSLQILVARDNGADLDKRQVDWCLEEMRGQCKNKKIQVVLQKSV